jgi:copper ion binding protein
VTRDGRPLMTTRPIDGPLEIVSLDVEGMTCASCVNRIERFLNKVDGVGEAAVNLATERAKISFDPALTTVEDLRGAVRAAGYEVRDEPAASAATTAEAVSMHTRRRAIARPPT